MQSYKGCLVLSVDIITDSGDRYVADVFIENENGQMMVIELEARKQEDGEWYYQENGVQVEMPEGYGRQD